MNLDDLYSLLATAELSNTSLADTDNNTIFDNRKVQVVNATNEALLRLYSRFLLAQKEVIIEMVEGTTFYHLLKKYAEQSYDASSGIYPYIRDLSREKFEEDVIKPLAVFGSWCPDALPLNDENQKFSIYTPQTTILQVPYPRPGEFLSLMYQARHLRLVNGSTNPDDTTIIVPDVLVGALTSYVGYRVFSHLNTENSSAKAQEYLSMYEKLCQEVEANDLVNASISTTSGKFHNNGWI